MSTTTTSPTGNISCDTLSTGHNTNAFGNISTGINGYPNVAFNVVAFFANIEIIWLLSISFRRHRSLFFAKAVFLTLGVTLCHISAALLLSFVNQVIRFSIGSPGLITAIPAGYLFLYLRLQLLSPSKIMLRTMFAIASAEWIFVELPHGYNHRR
jgi:hypothetical protein